MDLKALIDDYYSMFPAFSAARTFAEMFREDIRLPSLQILKARTMNPDQNIASVTSPRPLVEVTPYVNKQNADDLDIGTVFRTNSGEVFLRAWDSLVNLKSHRVLRRSDTSFSGIMVKEILGTLKLNA